MYRAATWLVMKHGVDPADTARIVELVCSASLQMGTDPAHPTVLIDGHDVTQAIREPEVSAAVSAVSRLPEVREHLIAQQRRIIRSHRRIVAEGRDITTVVAPDADVRVLLVADPAARVARRERELAGKVSQPTVVEQVIGRDASDAVVTQFHEAAPGVSLLDSTHLSLDEVIDQIADLAGASS